MDFRGIIEKAVSQYADRVAVWCDGDELTYRALFERSCRFANALSELGLGKGDRVALLGSNAFETAEQLWGLALGGFVRVALYAHESAEVNVYLCQQVGARALIVHHDLYPVIAPRLPEIASLEYVLVYGDEPADAAMSYERALASASPDHPNVETSRDDVHVIRFSAGTSGRPKGIVHTVGRWLDNDDEYRWVTPQIDERDSYLAAGPLTHAPVLWFWPLLQVGGRIVVMRAFEPGRALALIEEQRPTVTLMVPTMIQALLAHADIDTRDLSSLRCLNYAGEPITRPVMVRAMRRFGPVLYQLYAQSEAITITMLQPHEHPLDDEAGGQHSVGRATPNVTLRIVDENGEPVPRGSIGEVAVQAPGQMTELWNDPEATRARLLPDGSLLTRDMGYLDEDGFLYIVDRKEDMIISGGHNIWPAELENVIASYAGVREVCVLGVPHEKWGETPRAFVVADDGTVVDEDNLIAFTRERVGPIKKVTSVRVVDALPTSGVGKVLRRAVRERYRDEAPMHLEGA